MDYLKTKLLFAKRISIILIHINIYIIFLAGVSYIGHKTTVTIHMIGNFLHSPIRQNYTVRTSGWFSIARLFVTITIPRIGIFDSVTKFVDRGPHNVIAMMSTSVAFKKIWDLFHYLCLPCNEMIKNLNLEKLAEAVRFSFILIVFHWTFDKK